MRAAAATLLFLAVVSGRAVAFGPLDSLILREGRVHGVPFAIGESVVEQETGWDPRPPPNAEGSVGLWQLRLAYCWWYAEMFNGGRRFDPLDPWQETPVAIAYLSWLHAKYGSWWAALVAYNEGPGLVDAGVYLAPATDYANSVMERARRWGWTGQ